MTTQKNTLARLKRLTTKCRCAIFGKKVKRNGTISKSSENQYSRPLTDGEIALARSVFGDNIHLKNVQLKTAWWVLKNYAVSPNGNIYFNKADWTADFSHASLSKQSWLIHELTHVWQLQQGLNVVSGAVMNRRYAYVLIDGKPFFAYGIEQQARMVQDYFIQRARGQDCQLLAANIPFLQQKMASNIDSAILDA